jgi:hypothetical protein
VTENETTGSQVVEETDDVDELVDDLSGFRGQTVVDADAEIPSSDQPPQPVQSPPPAPGTNQ